jgi:outer membrane immunogenic protein
MNKGLTLLAAVSAAAIAVPAAAQSTSFSGPRVEALVGYDSSQPGSDSNIPNVEEKFDGVNYGVGVGYDIDLGSTVLGVEGELMESEAKTDFNTAGFATYGIANVDAGRDLYAGVRAGVKVGPNSLVYAKGGYTNARYNVLTTDNTTDTQTDLKVDGWRVGAGAQVNLSNNLYVKGEYRYSNYAGGEVESPTGVESDNFDVDLDRHQFVAGVGLKF